MAIPIVVCEAKKCPPDESFVDYFLEYWQDSSHYLTQNLSKYDFLDGNYGGAQFDGMIEEMIADGYSCDSLWNSWIQ
jgi:hypothetical protein